MSAIELFVGAGGLALGVSAAGFVPDIVVEWNQHACDTIRINQARGIAPVDHWPLIQADVRSIDYSDYAGRGITLVSGGPPCQPFSLGGKHAGYDDHRDMFPEAIRAVRETLPMAFIFENVKGLTRQSFANYLEYIRLQLTYPLLAKKQDETWDEHFRRLERHHTQGNGADSHYNVVMRVLNAADYGVPQCRERLFIVGFRSDIEAGWAFPEATHSRDALIWEQWVTGEYWGRHNVPVRQRPLPRERDARRVEYLIEEGARPAGQPWRTVRDAFVGLPDPADEKKSKAFLNHELRPGARMYAGHTGSNFDEPAKTLKAGTHGVPGGENMVVFPDGRLRYFTVRESARLQTFPDNYYFEGSWSEAMRQLGNAVPVTLGRAVAESVAAFLPQI